jgi:hypothetical protein
MPRRRFKSSMNGSQGGNKLQSNRGHYIERPSTAKSMRYWLFVDILICFFSSSLWNRQLQYGNLIPSSLSTIGLKHKKHVSFGYSFLLTTYDCDFS